MRLDGGRRQRLAGGRGLHQPFALLSAEDKAAEGRQAPEDWIALLAVQELADAVRVGDRAIRIARRELEEVVGRRAIEVVGEIRAPGPQPPLEVEAARRPAGGVGVAPHLPEADRVARAEIEQRTAQQLHRDRGGANNALDAAPGPSGRGGVDRPVGDVDARLHIRGGQQRNPVLAAVVDHGVDRIGRRRHPVRRLAEEADLAADVGRHEAVDPDAVAGTDRQPRLAVGIGLEVQVAVDQADVADTTKEGRCTDAVGHRARPGLVGQRQRHDRAIGPKPARRDDATVVHRVKIRPVDRRPRPEGEGRIGVEQRIRIAGRRQHLRRLVRAENERHLGALVVTLHQADVEAGDVGRGVWCREVEHAADERALRAKGDQVPRHRGLRHVVVDREGRGAQHNDAELPIEQEGGADVGRPHRQVELDLVAGAPAVSSRGGDDRRVGATDACHRLRGRLEHQQVTEGKADVAWRELDGVGQAAGEAELAHDSEDAGAGARDVVEARATHGCPFLNRDRVEAQVHRRAVLRILEPALIKFRPLAAQETVLHP